MIEHYVLLKWLHVVGAGGGARATASVVSAGAGVMAVGTAVRRPGAVALRRVASGGRVGVLSAGRGASGVEGVRRPTRLAP